ncbi:protein SOB FIVE-LIKE 5-like [Humulus lupulus]|uniref:protein SOB FIVE-LIKE 5-like n=1 Tax=Humulus lupulus TaxID=3486 RepID=UPI002B40A8EF|nr:protein SOB FIVE-LIKE 5-like [Humulus lupulus]
MNISASKFSASGCESGWTHYLDESNISEADKFKRDHKEENDCGYEEEEEEEVEEEEEDLSMVSDASSGPPHYHEDDHDQHYYENGSYISFSSSWAYNKSTNKDKKKMMKMKEKCTDEEHRSCLDDTASSPVSKKKSTFSRSKALVENVVDHSQGFSATHRGESAMGKHFDLYQSPMTKYSASQGPGDFQGRNWK